MASDPGFDILRVWLERIAENTAIVRDAYLKDRAVPGMGGPGAPIEDPGSRFERAMDALGKRFEGALQRWSRTPVERLINTGLDRSAQLLSQAAGSLLSQSRGLAQRGLSGTVEQARFDYATELLSRQVAAVMLPLTQGLTYFTMKLAQMGGQLSGTEQNRLLAMGMGAAVGARVGGLPGMIGGGLIGSFFGEDAFRPGAARGAAAGGLIGARMGGLPGAVFGTATGAAAGSAAHIEGEGPIAYMRRLQREEGASWYRSLFEASGRSLSVTVGGMARGVGIDTDIGRARSRAEYETAMAARAKPPEPRRDVTPYYADPTEAGGQAELIQKLTIRATAADGFKEDGGPFKPFFDLLLQIFEVLVKIGGGTVTRPASAEGARAAT